MPLMTLAQWQASGGRNAPPAFRGWDGIVQSYHAANNAFDKVTALGDILFTAYNWLRQNSGLQAQVKRPVDALRQNAQQDLDHLCGAGRGIRIYQDVVNHFLGRALTAKQIRVTVRFIHPVGAPPGAVQAAAISHLVNQHLAVANASRAFTDARLRLVRINPGLNLVCEDAAHQSILLPAIPAVPANMRGKFQDSAAGGERLIRVCNAAGAPARSIDVVYVEAFDQSDIQGRTFRGQGNYPVVPARSIVCVRTSRAAGGGGTYPTTLLHEMGHALTHCSGHSARADNLMASGANRNGQNRLTAGQIAWFRNNPYT